MKILYSSDIKWAHDIVKFGIGLFETMAYRDKEILFLDDHISRLKKSSKELSIGVNQVEDAEKKLKELSSSIGGSKAIRLTLSNFGYSIEERDIPYNRSNYEDGFRLCIYPYKRGENPYLRHKTTSYLENHYAKNIAKSKGFDDVLFVDYNDNLLECSTSNIIFKKDNKFIIPDFSNPILKGIAVTNIINELKKESEVIEGNINKNDINFMNRIYVCNSLLGLMPVKSIESKEFLLDVKLCERINNTIFKM